MRYLPVRVQKALGFLCIVFFILLIFRVYLFSFDQVPDQKINAGEFKQDIHFEKSPDGYTFRSDDDPRIGWQGQWPISNGHLVGNNS